VVDDCDNLNGLTSISSTDKIVDPFKYTLKCHSNNSISILIADSDAYRDITKSLTPKKVTFYAWQLNPIVLLSVFSIIPYRIKTLRKVLLSLATRFDLLIDLNQVLQPTCTR